MMKKQKIEKLIREVEEDKSSSLPFAAARVVEEDKSSSPPSFSRAIAKGEEESLLSSPSLRESSVYEEYAKQNKFKLNPNKEVVERLIKGMLAREKQFGKRYCCCRRITGIPEEDEKIVCPCVYAYKEIAEQGHCLCGLFVKE